MEKIRVLIADDSIVYRSQIRAALSRFEEVEVIGVASNGRIACDLLSQSKVDLLILDLEMPEMDGLQTLIEMKARGLVTTKVLLFSSFSKRGAEITLEALRLGANDFITKPGQPVGPVTAATSPDEKIRALLEPKMRALFREEKPSSIAPVFQKRSGSERQSPSGQDPMIIVIGASTGGPQLLEAIFSQLHGPLKCPIVIVQHMPPLFTAALAERLQKVSGVAAREAQNLDRLENQIYIAPGDHHVVVAGSIHAPHLQINKEALENFVRPAVDPLFRSAAKVFGRSCLGVVLTGMGSDGKLGAEAIQSAGGSIVIQSKETCAVFGMPGAIFDAGAYDQIASPDEITFLLQSKTRSVAA